MSRDVVENAISKAIRFFAVCLVFLLLLSLIMVEGQKKSPEEQQKYLEEVKELRAAVARGETKPTNQNLPEVWPPKMNAEYPDFELIDQDGKTFRISNLKGSVVIVEYIDMTSPASQAQSGAAKTGTYGALQASELDDFVQPFSDVLFENTDEKLTWPQQGLMHIKVIIYGETGDPGSRDDATQWAEHFGYTEGRNTIVAVPVKDMRDETSQSLISGFQLVDKNLVLRVDSAGNLPKHNLKLTLIPLVPKLLKN